MLYLHAKQYRADGTYDVVTTLELESKDAPLAWQESGLSYTAAGYGKRIPTRSMVRVHGKWRRVYCCIYSNIGTCYIGKLAENLTIRDYPG